MTGIRLDNVIRCSSRRWFVLIACILDLIWFSGHHFGIFSVVSKFKAKGIFVCLPQEKCTDTDTMYSYAFIVWNLAPMVLIILAGLILDYFGLRIMKLISVTIWSAGTFMLAFCNAKHSWLFFLSGALIGTGAISSIMCGQQISQMFDRYRGLIIAFLAASFDSSSIVPYIFAVAQSELSLMYGVDAALGAIWGILIAIFLFTWWSDDMAGYCPDRESFSIDAKTDESHEVEELDLLSQLESSKESFFPTLRSCFRSLEFFLINLWMSVGYLRLTHFLSSLNQTLHYAFPTGDTADEIATASSAFFIGALLAAPVSGTLIDLSAKIYKKRILKCFDPRNESFDRIRWMTLGQLAPPFLTLAIVSHIISSLLFINHKAAYYTAFVFFVLLRSLLFSSQVNAILTSFPHRNFGMIYGLVCASAGVFSLLQYALLLLNPFNSNVAWIVISCLLYVSPIIMFIKSR